MSGIIRCKPKTKGAKLDLHIDLVSQQPAVIKVTGCCLMATFFRFGRNEHPHPHPRPPHSPYWPPGMASAAVEARLSDKCARNAAAIHNLGSLGCGVMMHSCRVGALLGRNAVDVLIKGI